LARCTQAAAGPTVSAASISMTKSAVMRRIASDHGDKVWRRRQTMG
jgi:hypothetical protein